MWSNLHEANAEQVKFMTALTVTSEDRDREGSELMDCTVNVLYDICKS